MPHARLLPYVIYNRLASSSIYSSIATGSVFNGPFSAVSFNVNPKDKVALFFWLKSAWDDAIFCRRQANPDIGLSAILPSWSFGHTTMKAVISSIGKELTCQFLRIFVNPKHFETNLKQDRKC